MTTTETADEIVVAAVDRRRALRERSAIAQHDVQLIAETWDQAQRLLLHPDAPPAVKAAVARAVKGPQRRMLQHTVAERAGVADWRACWPLFTSAALEGILYRAYREPNPFAVRSPHPVPAGLAVDRVTLMKTWANHRDGRARAIIAEAAPLTFGQRHSWSTGQLSAPRLLADPLPAVRIGLARNYDTRTGSTPYSDRDLTEPIRNALLADPNPRVRAAALRNGLHVNEEDMIAAMQGVAGLPVTISPVIEAQSLLRGEPLDDPDANVRAAAVRMISPADQARWRRVTSDPSPIVRKAAANTPLRSPETLVTLMLDPDPVVRKAVAASRWTPHNALDRLACDPDTAVAEIAQRRIIRDADRD